MYDQKQMPLSTDDAIDRLQISSEPGQSFFLAAIGPSVHKFDIITKKALCEFKTFSDKAMVLFDKD